MKDSRLQKLIREGLLDMFRKPKEEPQEKRILFVHQIPIDATAEDFRYLKSNDTEKLKAFEDAWKRGNDTTRDSLRTLLNTEPYSQKKDFVDKYDAKLKQYQNDLKTGKAKSSISSKSSVGGVGDSSTGSSSSRIAGMSGLFEEQLRMQLLAGLITETEYREKLNKNY
jgi:hypothetical protein